MYAAAQQDLKVHTLRIETRTIQARAYYTDDGKSQIAKMAGRVGSAFAYIISVISGMSKSSCFGSVTIITVPVIVYRLFLR